MLPNEYKAINAGKITEHLSAAVNYMIDNKIAWNQTNIANALNVICGYKSGQGGVSRWAARHMTRYCAEFDRYHNSINRKV